MTQPLLLIPLDARPCTYRFPIDLAAIAGLPVIAPPVAPPTPMLGDLHRPANPDALQAWLQSHAPHASALVVALDTLAYGGLIPSRRDNTPLPQLQERLSILRKLKAQHPGLPLYGFSVTMRLSDSNDATEEKPYWAQFGKLLYRYSFHLDKFEQEHDPQDQAIALEAMAQIPAEILADYRETRQRNFALNRMLIDWTAEGILDLLLLTQDDTSRFGFNVREQRQLLADVQAKHLAERVRIYPGADEVASVLVAHHLNRISGHTPKFHLSTSTPDGAGITAMYEDRPLAATAAGQVEAAGGILVERLEDADIALMLNTPATGQGDLALRIRLELPDTPARDLAPFARALAENTRPVALADVAYANGADPALFEHFQDYPKLAAFAAWNTAGNTLGTVVAQASAFLAMTDARAQEQFLLDRMADDLLYQAFLRPELQKELAAGRSIDDLEKEVGPRLEALWRARFPQFPIAGITASLPWHRLFEADVRVHP